MPAHLKTDSLAHDEGHGLGFRLAHSAVVMVRRSLLCKSSCPASWTKVTNSSAFDWPGSRAIFPP